MGFSLKATDVQRYCSCRCFTDRVSCVDFKQVAQSESKRSTPRPFKPKNSNRKRFSLQRKPSQIPKRLRTIQTVSATSNSGLEPQRSRLSSSPNLAKVSYPSLLTISRSWLAYRYFSALLMEFWRTFNQQSTNITLIVTTAAPFPLR